MTGEATLDTRVGWAHRDGVVDLKAYEPARVALVSPADRAAICELFARYAIAYDERRLDVLASVLDEDAVYEAHLGSRTLAVFKGRDAAVEGMHSVMKQQGDDQRRHHIGNIVLDGLSPSEISATAYASIVVIGSDGLTLGASAIYGCELTSRDGGWRFTKIVVGMDGYAGRAPEH